MSVSEENIFWNQPGEGIFYCVMNDCCVAAGINDGGIAVFSEDQIREVMVKATNRELYYGKFRLHFLPFRRLELRS